MDHYYNRYCTVSFDRAVWFGVHDGPKFRLHSKVSEASVARVLRIAATAATMSFVASTYCLPAAVTFCIDGTCPNT